MIHPPRTPFLESTVLPSSHLLCDRARLDATPDLPRESTHMARLDRTLGPRRRRARALGHPRRASQALCVHLVFILVPVLTAAPDRRASAPSTLRRELYAELLPVRSSALQGTILPFGPGTFTHNTAGVPVVVASTKAEILPNLSVPTHLGWVVR